MRDQLRSWIERHEERRLEQLHPERHVHVSTNEHGIGVDHPNGQHQAVSWSEATRVFIETNDSGPLGMDWWWIVESPETLCEFPDGSRGEKEARAAFTAHLKGLDWDAVIDAVGCTENARFVCWEKQRAG